MISKVAKKLIGIALILLSLVDIIHAQNHNIEHIIEDSDFEMMLNLAKEKNSDAFVIEKSGELIVNYQKNRGEIIETMSVTKLVVAAGIGRLLYQGYIDSLDQPIHSFYPEWNQGQKKQITLRHLLSHTSGLQNELNTTVEIYPSPDVIQLALAAELESEPGSEFIYNNKAVNLLAGIFERATGQKMNLYIDEEIFKKVGIINYDWTKDKAGNPYAMAGLKLNAKDLVKIGRLILNNGIWEGEQLISPEYLDQMLGVEDSGQSVLFGLLWRKLPERMNFTITEADIERFRDHEVNEHYIDKLRPYVGRKIEGSEINKIYINIFESPDIFHREFTRKGVQTVFQAEVGEITGYYGDGDLGQYLILLPDEDIVIVRQIKSDSVTDPENQSFQELLQFAAKGL